MTKTHVSVIMSRLGTHFSKFIIHIFLFTPALVLKRFWSELGAQIINSDNVQEAARETEGYFIKSGIVTVIKDALIPAGTLI